MISIHVKNVRPLAFLSKGTKELHRMVERLFSTWRLQIKLPIPHRAHNLYHILLLAKQS